MGCEIIPKPPRGRGGGARCVLPFITDAQLTTDSSASRTKLLPPHVMQSNTEQAKASLSKKYKKIKRETARQTESVSHQRWRGAKANVPRGPGVLCHKNVNCTSTGSLLVVFPTSTCQRKAATLNGVPSVVYLPH